MYKALEIQCIFYIYGTSHAGWAKAQELHRQVWLVATSVANIILEKYFSNLPSRLVALKSLGGVL